MLQVSKLKSLMISLYTEGRGGRLVFAPPPSPVATTVGGGCKKKKKLSPHGHHQLYC